MNICKIIKIAPDGKPWGAPPNGPYYPFYITFADGAAGQANAKTNPPAYKVGDEVGYEITGATPRGVPKLKIDRKADPAFCPNTTPQDHHPDLEAAPPAQKPPYNRPAALAQPQPPPAHGNAVNGQTVGMAVKAAIDLTISTYRNTSTSAPDTNTDEFWNLVHTSASNIIRVSQRLERGDLAPPPEELPPF